MAQPHEVFLPSVQTLLRANLARRSVAPTPGGVSGVGQAGFLSMLPTLINTAGGLFGLFAGQSAQEKAAEKAEKALAAIQKQIAASQQAFQQQSSELLAATRVQPTQPYTAPISTQTMLLIGAGLVAVMMLTRR
jgi:hypothetical protein